MALTTPSLQDFYSLWGDEADTSNEERATSFLEVATYLMWLATGLDNDPKDPRLSNMVQLGICDMAIYLYVTRDDIDENYSPFQSERVGSYNYSKSYLSEAKAQVAAAGTSQPTGVPLFDSIVQYFITESMSSGSGWGHNTHLSSLEWEARQADPNYRVFSDYYPQ